MRSRIIIFCLLLFVSKLPAQFADAPGDTLVPAALNIRFNCSKEVRPAIEDDFEPTYGNPLAACFLKAKIPYKGWIKSVNGQVLARVEEGRLVFLRYSENKQRYYLFYRLVAEPLYAQDSLFVEGVLRQAHTYSKDSSGYWRTTSNFDEAGVQREQISEKYKPGKSREPCFSELVTQGRQVTFDETGRITSSRSMGAHGEYEDWCLLYEPESQESTTGQYKNGGEEGAWETKDSSGTLVREEWFHAGKRDSLKSWFANGKPAEVSYDYVPGYGAPVSLTRMWYANGKRNLVQYNSGIESDTSYATWYETGILHYSEITVAGRLQKKEWYENGRLKTEMYGNGQRDSLYREWDESGKLLKEKLYRGGNFISSSLPVPPNPVLSDTNLRRKMLPIAYQCLMTAAERSKQSWDTSVFVPQTVLDSVCSLLMETYVYWQKARPQNGAQWLIENTSLHTRYEFDPRGLTLDSLHPFSTDARISALMNSCRPVQVKVSVGSSRWTDFSSTQVLNLHWINQKLSQLHPGAGLYYNWPQRNVFVRIFPVGTKTSFGRSIPYTIIAFAVSSDEDDMRNESIHRRENYYEVVYRYTDGDFQTAAPMGEQVLEAQYPVQK